MKRLVVFLAVALVLVFAVSALAEMTPEPSPTPAPQSKTIDDETGVDDGGDDSRSTRTTTTTTVAADPDATLNDDVSKYTNNPKAIIADYGIDTFKEPVIYESVTTVGTNTDSLTISQKSLTEDDEIAVYIVYRLNGKIKRVRIYDFHWENGKIVVKIPANIALEIIGKQFRIDVISEAK
jgi:hypothetical protein